MTTEDTQWMMLYIGNPQKIKTVHGVLEAITTNFALWSPMQEVTFRINNQDIIKQRPLFPGYVLVNFGSDVVDIEEKLLEANAGFFLKNPGSSKRVSLSKEQIEQIKEIERTKINETPQAINIDLGSYVDVTSGVFLGARGTVIKIRGNSVIVELEMFGRFIQVPIDARFIRVHSIE